MSVTPLSVFISSTCYDLVDLRAELGVFLRSQGFEVRLSEDPMSAFYVDPEGDSIESCLANVRNADVVVCILDRRYGPVLETGGYPSYSATEAEVRHARDQAPPKPVFFFMREPAFQEYHQLRTNPAFSPKWVDRKNREKWVAFADYAVKLPEHAQRSNWCDQFKAVSDLKPLVLKRLLEKFPRQAAALALRPDRFVRVHFRVHRLGMGTIEGCFQNVGIGPALNLTHGWTRDSVFPPEEEIFRGGLAEGEAITLHDGAPWCYTHNIGNELTVIVFCNYANRFGDRYRTEIEFHRDNNKAFAQLGRDRLYVDMSKDPDCPEWRVVGGTD